MSLVSHGAGQMNAASAAVMARTIVPNADKLTAGTKLFCADATLNTLAANTTIAGESVAFNAHVTHCGNVLFSNPPYPH